MAEFTGGAGLLARAITYGLGGMGAVAGRSLSCATPCADWDLRMLLRHVNDSLGVLQEGIDAGCVDVDAEPPGDGDDSAADPIAVFHTRVNRLLTAWMPAGRRRNGVDVAGHPLTHELIAVTGAIEIAVHCWDISVACGRQRPIPAELALDMLLISPLVVNDGLRYPLFAAPIAVSTSASPSDQLVGFLGRSPAA